LDRSVYNRNHKKIKCKNKDILFSRKYFYKSKNLIGDEHLKISKIHTHYWTVSTDAQKILESKYPKTGRWHLVHPFLEHDVISFVREDAEQRENAILCLARKGKSYIFFAKLLLGREIKFDVINRKFTEIEAYKLMAKYKFFLSTAVGVSPQLTRNMAKLLIGRRRVKVINPYREGFPLPPAEAAACGSISIGFAMGGGLEWMSPSTCFLAKDRSYFSLMTKIKEALSASDEQLNTMRENAFKAVSEFNKEHTWKQVKSFLEETI